MQKGVSLLQQALHTTACNHYFEIRLLYYIERDESERAEYIEVINDLPEDVEIFYADESGFEEVALMATLSKVSVYMEKYLISISVNERSWRN